MLLSSTCNTYLIVDVLGPTLAVHGAVGDASIILEHPFRGLNLFDWRVAVVFSAELCCLFRREVQVGNRKLTLFVPRLNEML